MFTLFMMFLVFSLIWGILKFTLKLTWGLIKFTGFLFLIFAGPAFIGSLLLFGFSAALFLPCLMFGLGLPMFICGVTMV